MSEVVCLVACTGQELPGLLEPTTLRAFWVCKHGALGPRWQPRSEVNAGDLPFGAEKAARPYTLTASFLNTTVRA